MFRYEFQVANRILQSTTNSAVLCYLELPLSCKIDVKSHSFVVLNPVRFASLLFDSGVMKIFVIPKALPNSISESESPTIILFLKSIFGKSF